MSLHQTTAYDYPIAKFRSRLIRRLLRHTGIPLAIELSSSGLLPNCALMSFVKDAHLALGKVS